MTATMTHRPFLYRLFHCLIASLLLLGSPAFAAISAEVDRPTVAQGETLSLTLTGSDGDSIGQPDLAALEPNFRVLGQSSSRNIQIINFKKTTTERLTIRLLAQKIGEHTIPAIKAADGSSQPIKVTVTHPANQPQQTGDASLFMRTEVSPAKVYVGQQAVLSVKLYYNTDLNSGNIDAPDIPDTSLRTLGDPQQYSAQVGGQQYRVYQQDFALFPSQAGKLDIPPITFQGQKVEQNYDRFFGNMPGFGRMVPVTLASPATSLTVKDIPAQWSGMWLPAHQLSLTQSGLPGNLQATVGTPINLHLSLTALGLPATSLPDLTLPDMDGASVYADKDTSQTGMSGNLLKGEKSRRFAILPQQPGKLVIPAISLTWFNTTTGKKEITQVPEQVLTVLPATDSLPGNAPLTTSLPADQQASTSSPVISTSIQHDSHWKTAFLLSLLLWLGLVFVLLKQRRDIRKQPASRPPHEPSGKKAFLRKLRQQDKTLLQDLLAWAQAEQPHIKTLSQLKQQLAAPQAQAINQLEAWCYGSDALTDDIRPVFVPGLRWKKVPINPDPVSPLYPHN